MNCQICKLNLEDFLEERLEADRLEEFQGHYEKCADCRALVEDAVFGRAVSHAAFPAEPWNASPQFYSRLWQSIETERAKPFSWVVVRDLALRFVAGVALMIALLVAADAISGPKAGENQMAIDNYMEAPGAPDAFRDVLIGDVSTNRDQLLKNLMVRDRQQNSLPPSQAPQKETPNP
ncbi:MAG: anti-sigma factor family protein [Terriglobia bacterium]